MKMKDLEKLNKLKAEYKGLEIRISKIKPSVISKDSVQASTSEFPYIQYTAKIEGYEYPYQKKKLEKQLKSKKHLIEKTINHIEYELNYIDDPDIREIIRYKYYDGLNNVQTAFKMNEKLNRTQRPYTDDSVRKKLDRYFEKN